MSLEFHIINLLVAIISNAIGHRTSEWTDSRFNDSDLNRVRLVSRKYYFKKNYII